MRMYNTQLNWKNIIEPDVKRLKEWLVFGTLKENLSLVIIINYINIIDCYHCY
jgi:hypothetical protein